MPEHQWLVALAGWGIGTQQIPACPGSLTSMLPEVKEHKLIGVLAAAIAQEQVPASDSERDAVKEAHRRAMGEVLLLEEMLLAAVEVLESAGIAHRVLKGSALAHTVHPDPSHRSFGDNDILVESDQINHAADALIAAGAVRKHQRLSESFDRRFAKSITLDWLHNTEIDLHRTLAPGPFGLLIDPSDLWTPAAVFEIASRQLSTFSPELHLLNAALHVALGDVEPRLGNLRDLALLCNTESLDHQAVIDMASRWRCQAPVAAGVDAAAALGVDPGTLGEWAASREITPKEASLMSAYSRVEGRFRRQSMASLRVLPTWRDRLAYASAVVRNPLRRAMGRRYARRP